MGTALPDAGNVSIGGTKQAAHKKAALGGERRMNR